MTTAAHPTTTGTLAFPARNPRTQCPECGRSISVTADGTVRDHKFLTAPCPGSRTAARFYGRAVVAR